ncbi:oligosaccharide flippase family protein [Salinivibrio costicola]|uniref:Oligosaccharide flippase family protein n=1 Tax=Salinivibrio costicola subsp. alcaliphilus TaxID=272773 RepID=A0ABX3KLY6_SALCS|nr:oligosaccharide flippase family protein [Salinivibrio costicola]OOF32717.1 hypothetical protein BZJ21_14605 [Salinivibrio costicola subsp. alcaliphilus]
MFKNILRLMVGNGSAQLIQFGSIPILTRFYSPEDFGVFSIAIAISGVLTVISSLQLNVAIVSLKSYVAVCRLLSSALLLNVMMITVSVLLTFSVSYIFYDGTINPFLILLIVFIAFFSSLNNLLKGVFVYLGTFSSLAKTFLFRSMTIASLQFLFIFTSTSNGLIFGLLVGEIIMFVTLLFVVQLQLRKKVLTVSKRTLKRLFISLKQLKAFSLYGTMQELVSVAVFWLPLFIITTIFGSAIGGEYSVSARILWPATVLLTGAVAQVLFHRMVNIQKEKIAEELFLSHYFKLLFIPLIFAAYYLSPMIFDFILNEQWEGAISLSKYVAILCVIFIYVMPYRVIFRVLHLQKKQLIIETFISFLLLTSLLVIDFSDVELLLVYIAIVMLIQAFLQELYIRKALYSDG